MAKKKPRKKARRQTGSDGDLDRAGKASPVFARVGAESQGRLESKSSSSGPGRSGC